MFFRSLLGLDLSGKLATINKNDKKKDYFFDSENIICIINVIEKQKYFYFTACSYCDDPHVGGFDMSPVSRIFSTKKSPTKIEAYAILEQEIRRATKKHPNTRFYREKFNPSKNQPLYEFCLNGEWIDAEMLPSLRRCRDCYSPVPEDETCCRKCGSFPL